MDWHTPPSKLSVRNPLIRSLRPISTTPSFYTTDSKHVLDQLDISTKRPHEIPGDTAAFDAFDAFDAADRMADLKAELQQLSHSAQSWNVQIYNTLQWLQQPSLQNRPELEADLYRLQFNYNTVVTNANRVHSQIQKLQFLVDNQQRQKEKAEAAKKQREQDAFEEWKAANRDGEFPNREKDITQYRAFLKEAEAEKKQKEHVAFEEWRLVEKDGEFPNREKNITQYRAFLRARNLERRADAKRQKEEDDEAKATAKEAVRQAIDEANQAKAAAEAAKFAEWKVANPDGTAGEYKAALKKAEKQARDAAKLQDAFQAWVATPGNEGRTMEAYKDFIKTSNANKAAEDRRKAALAEWNKARNDKNMGNTTDFGADMKRKTAWMHKNKDKSQDYFLNYLAGFERAKAEWLQENPNGDYEESLQRAETERKKKEAWEKKYPFNNYEEHLKELERKAEEKKTAWIKKFSNGMADGAAYDAWKTERAVWANEKPKCSNDYALQTYMIDYGNKREAYEDILLKYAQSGNSYNEWSYARDNNSKWRSKVIEGEMVLLESQLAALGKYEDLTVLAKQKIVSLDTQLFTDMFDGSGQGDLDNYRQWKANIATETNSKIEQAELQGVTKEATPQTFYVWVTLYYEQLEAAMKEFTEQKITPSWGDWVGEGGGFEQWQRRKWFKDKLAKLRTKVNQANFATPEEEQDYRAAFEFLEALKTQSDERAVRAKEVVKEEATAARQARKEERMAAQEEAARAKDEFRRAAAAVKAAEKAAKSELREQAKAASEAFKKARKEARDAAREERRKVKFAELKTEISGKPLELASQLLVIDEERERLQKLFNELEFEPGHALHKDKDPEQPREARVTGRLSGSRGSAPQGVELVPGEWPIAQMKLSEEQHLHLFMTETDVFSEVDEPKFAESEDPEVGVKTSGAAESSISVSKLPNKSGVKILDSATVFAADPLLFNRSFAKRLLTAHVNSLKEMHTRSMHFNPKVKYSNVGEAVNADTNTTVEQVLPFFETMLRYRNTMLMAKTFMLQQEMQLALKGSANHRALAASLKTIESFGLKPQWAVEALRMIEADNGRLPGQLYQRQPHFLPLRIFAPPRVGKSATALLTASIAKRVGMVTLYSVSPNKNTPIAELSKKLARMGWGDPQAAQEADRVSANRMIVDISNVQDERMCLQMRYNYYSVENVPGGPSAPGLSSKSKCTPDYNNIDMVMYSSDVADDAMRVGAILSDFKLKPVVTFHIRDEAQSLAKELKNEVMSCHKVDVPPPVLLQYLRAYYSNLYSLNCNVTATHFPTLLEYDLYGFMGTIEQNIRAGIPMTAPPDKISTYLGSHFLPKLVPALQPLRPTGYIGVDHFVTWTNSAQVEVTLQVGANHSGLNESGALRDSGTASASSSSGGAVETTVTEEQVERLAALRAEKLELESKRGKNKNERAFLRNRLATIRDDIEAIEAVEGRLDALSVLASNTQEETTNEADFDYSSDDDDGDDDKETKQRTDAEKIAKAKGKQERQNKRASDREADKNRNKEMAEKDANAVKLHFIDYLNSQPLTVIQRDGVNTFKMMPTYIGALNARISSRGMSSILRMLGSEAHQRASSVAKEMRTRSKYGVAFLLYTSTMNSRKDVSNDKIKIVGDKGGKTEDRMDVVEQNEADGDKGNFDSMAKDELRNMLRDKKIPFKSKANKAELVQILREAIEAELDLSTKSLADLQDLCRNDGLPVKGANGCLEPCNSHTLHSCTLRCLFL